jgi:hypothetical protein
VRTFCTVLSQTIAVAAAAARNLAIHKRKQTRDTICNTHHMCCLREPAASTGQSILGKELERKIQTVLAQAEAQKKKKKQQEKTEATESSSPDDEPRHHKQHSSAEEAAAAERERLARNSKAREVAAGDVPPPVVDGLVPSVRALAQRAALRVEENRRRLPYVGLREAARAQCCLLVDHIRSERCTDCTRYYAVPWLQVMSGGGGGGGGDSTATTTGEGDGRDAASAASPPPPAAADADAADAPAEEARGVPGHTTYRLMLDLVEKRAANVYTLYGDKLAPLVLPKKNLWNEPPPAGVNLGGVWPALRNLTKTAAFDSYLTVGPVAGNPAGMGLGSVGIDFGAFVRSFVRSFVCPICLSLSLCVCVCVPSS